MDWGDISPPLPPAAKKAARVDVYRAADGTPVLMVLRAEPKGFTQWTPQNDKWLPKGVPQGTKIPVLGLPAIVAAPAAPVLVVEGEKTAAAALAYVPEGWLVTTWAGGSGAVARTDWAALRGRPVAIWPDHDRKTFPADHKRAGELLPPEQQPGMKAALKIAEATGGRIVELPDNLPDGWDLADPLPEDFRRSEVQAAMMGAIEYVTQKSKDLVGESGSEFQSPGSPTTESDVPSEDRRPEPPPWEPPAESLPETTAAALIRELAGLGALEYGLRRRAAAKSLGIPAGLLDKEVARSRQVPTTLNGHASNLIFAANGSIVPVFTNAAEIIRAHPKEWPLAFDEFSQRPFIGQQPMADGDLQRIAEWVQRQGILAGRKIIDDAALYVANLNKFHEVKDWLETLEWDGIGRIDMILIDHAGAEDTELMRAFTSKWMIQAIARLYEPGCQADATLILEGRQDLGKSTLLRGLFGDRWFTDHLPDLSSKDAMIQLLGIWCIEISELAAVGRVENSKVKQFLTSRDDRFRLPWDRLAAQHPRQSVFAATVNPGASGYLKDETGGRRWWPAAVKRVDINQIYDRREQFWAEALHRYRKRERWHLTDAALLEQAKATQSDRYIGDVWMEEIEQFIQNRQFVTLPEIFREVLSLNSKADWGQREETRVARCLTHLNWNRTQRRVNQKPTWGYVPPEPPGESADADQPSLGFD